MDVSFWEGQASWSWLPVFSPGQLSVEFVNVGVWLTYGDLALDSCAQFLAVAEHRLIPSGGCDGLCCFFLETFAVALPGLGSAR